MIKQSLVSLLYLIAVLSFLCGCTKPEDTINFPTDKELYDVYIAGYESNGEHLVAKYWKNGVETILSDGSQDAQAKSIFVSNNSVYVVGYESNGNKNVAKYWKDGVETSLTDGSQNACANYIFKINNDIHIVGGEGDFIWGDFNRQPVHWKNGVSSVLSVGRNEGEALSIANDGGNIYILIQEFNNRAAGYWKNDDGYRRVTTWLDVNSYCMTVVDGNVYIAGVTINEGPTYIASLWENGFRTYLSETHNYTNANALAIAIEDKDIYVGGYENGKAIYWKNGIPFKLPNGQRVSAISVSDGNVFVAGTTRSSNGNVVKFWKNLEETTITDGKYGANANAMVVVKNK